ncbi:MAG TPA: nuclear transport factor 2 family protein [Solirubrobacteraceae bacterium]|nr:nuclear transport factor 2 family protein [Solirubrobacteraceae bacterium]
MSAPSRADLERLSERWLPRAEELEAFGDRWVRAWNEHDLDALDAMVTDDVRWDDPAMRGATAEGRDEFREFAQLFVDAFPDVEVRAVGAPLLALDGRTFAVRSRMTGTFAGELRPWRKAPDAMPPLPPTGRRFDIRAVDVYELRDGKVADWTLVYDLLEFGRQIAGSG